MPVPTHYSVQPLWPHTSVFPTPRKFRCDTRQKSWSPRCGLNLTLDPARSRARSSSSGRPRFIAWLVPPSSLLSYVSLCGCVHCSIALPGLFYQSLFSPGSCRHPHGGGYTHGRGGRVGCGCAGPSGHSPPWTSRSFCGSTV